MYSVHVRAGSSQDKGTWVIGWFCEWGLSDLFVHSSASRCSRKGKRGGGEVRGVEADSPDVVCTKAVEAALAQQ